MRAIETLNAGLFARTVDRKLLFANDRMLEWLGYAPEEIDGRDVLMLIPEELRAAYQAEAERIDAGDERARIGVLRRKDGRTFPVVNAPHVLRGDDGSVLAIIGVCMDLGEVQTARRVASMPPTGIAASLERIAGELQAISLVTDSSATPVFPHAHPELDSLSAREREILVELVSGLRVPAIARKLFISPHTVRNHLKSMYRKLDVSDQGALIERVRHLAAHRPDHPDDD
jgi:PAS domain S-box-containing protein